MIEAAELEGFNRSDTETLKAFITRRQDRTDLKYRNTVETFPRRLAGRIGGADLESKPSVKLVFKSRFGVVRNAGNFTGFTSQSVPKAHPKASKYGGLKPTRKPQVTQSKRIGDKRGAGEPSR